MNQEVKKEIQIKNLGNLIKCGGFEFTDSFFPYTSGQIGPYYVQSIDITKDGEAYAEAIRSLETLIREYLPESYIENSVISGGESRDWDFSNPVSVRLEIPHFKIYKDGKTLGAIVKRKDVIHVADLNNEGSSPRDSWVPAIKKAGGKIENIFFYVDRLEDGFEVMKELGLNSYSVIPLDKHAWDWLLKLGNITPEIYKSLCERMEHKNEWARKTLRSEKGVQKLFDLMNNPETYEKGMKILEKGYPDMKEEMFERIKLIGF